MTGHDGPAGALTPRMRHSPPRSRDGFTFIEILVVFVVFAAAAMISVRSVGDTLRRDRVAKSAAVLASDIEQAFAIAARQRVPVRMVVDRANRKLTVVDRNTPTLVYKTRSFQKGGAYEIDSLYADTARLEIMPNGLATNEMQLGLIVSTTGGALYQKSVKVSKGGLVRVNNR
jgi:prepilin-type N-terminal cleavage/methylation domain-containing protein